MESEVDVKAIINTDFAIFLFNIQLFSWAWKKKKKNRSEIKYNILN